MMRRWKTSSGACGSAGKSQSDSSGSVSRWLGGCTTTTRLLASSADRSRSSCTSWSIMTRSRNRRAARLFRDLVIILQLVHDDRDRSAELASNRVVVVQPPSHLDTEPDESLCDLPAEPHAPLEVFHLLIIGIG